jgi:hypothetical protein
MAEYSDVAQYLRAIRGGSAPPILPLQMVADHLGVSRAAVDQMLRNEGGRSRLVAVMIDGQRFVDARSVIAREDNRERDVSAVRHYLEERARDGHPSVFYEPVMDKIGRSWRVPADRSYIGSILGEISEGTHAENRFLLSVLVHRKTGVKTRPGEGFFQLAKKLKYNWKAKDFIESETKRVLDYYRKKR